MENMNCIKQMNVRNKGKRGDWRVAISLGATSRDGLLGEINRSAPKRSKEDDGSIGDASHSSRVSDHNPNEAGVVCARDFTHDPAGGFDCEKFTAWLRDRMARGLENRVKYLIWNRLIVSGPGQAHPAGLWRKYTGSNPHTAHCHVSVRLKRQYYDDDKPWGWGSA